MKLWLGLAALFLLAFGVQSAAADADETVEYRTVTLLDGTAYRGIVSSSDAETLKIRTSTGEKTLPLMDIVQIQSISRDEFLKEEGLLVLYLPLENPPALASKAAELDALLAPALSRELLGVLRVSDLPQSEQERLRACPDTACKLAIASENGFMVVKGSLERRGRRDVITLQRLDRQLQQVGTVSSTIGAPDDETDRLTLLAAVLLGEEPATALNRVEKEPGEPQADTSEKPEDITETPTPATHEDNIVKTDEEKKLERARRLDLIPVPGLSSTECFDNRIGTAVSGGVVAVVTGLTVSFVGDTRRLGFERGLHVSWTYEERGFNDAALLTGVGVATYLASTWLTNYVVRKINIKRSQNTPEKAVGLRW